MLRWLFSISCLLAIPASAQGSFGGSLDALTHRQDFVSMRSSSSAEDLGSNGDSREIPPGETLMLLDADGPGIITHIWNTIAAFDPFAGRSVVLRIYYDGNELPSVQAPLGDFFGVGHGANKSFTSMPVTVSAGGLSRSCYWRMPFLKHIKITVTNESPVYPVADFYFYVDWQKHEKLPEDTQYFHAEYRQSMPAEKGHYTILERKGTGLYVGTVYSAQQVELGWFGEGDDFIYIDGSETPQLRGTGTEDYFNDAWGFREFNAPFHGVSLYEGAYPGDRVTAYRWHIMDPIAFKDSIKVTIEHRGSATDETAPIEDSTVSRSNERPDWVSSVGFWYQYPPVLIDAALPPVEKRIAPYRVFPVSDLVCRADDKGRILPSEVGKQYITAEKTGFFELEFPVTEAGRYQLSGMFQDNPESAVFQAVLDGKNIGLPIVMAVEGGGFAWHQLDSYDLTPGTHTLRFEKLDEVVPVMRSTGLKEDVFAIEYLVLLRLEDMAGYHELLNQKKAQK